MKSLYNKTKEIIVVFFLLAFSLLLNAQPPEKISFQAVIRDNAGQLIVEQQVGMRITILQGSIEGTPVFTETHVPETNENGLVIIAIGGGTSNDDFSAINWAEGTYFIKVETDPEGGSIYTISGTNQLLSVPYALHAKTAETLTTEFQGLIPVLTTSEITELTPQVGQTVLNSVGGLFQIYDGIQWISFSGQCWPQPTTANAGPDQYLIEGTVTTTLAGNLPETHHGTGRWSILSGVGGSFADETDPFTQFSGQIFQYYKLQWKISTSCGQSVDDITIFFGNDGASGAGVTDIDGNFYPSIFIGQQEWMAENLKNTKYRNGTPIEYPGANNTDWQNNTTGAYAWYNNDIGWKDSYGALYNWHAVNNSNGLCPAGWHVPSVAEWAELENYLIALGYPNEQNNPNGAGNALKSCRQVFSPLGGDCATSEHPRWNSNSVHYGFDGQNFSAFPGGYRFLNGNFHALGASGRWWTSNQSGGWAYYRGLDFNVGFLFPQYNEPINGYSVRCIKD